MLSIENPPPDLQQLKITIKDHENQNLPLPQDQEDLSNDTVLDDHHSTFPNFSLRDYVFSARSKDIQNNWPFSLKNLQLCLKHGVKDLLPPFQSPDCVRNQQRVLECGGGSSTSEFRNTSVFHGNVSEHQEHVEEQDASDAKIDEQQVNTCRCEGENGLASTMTSNLQPQKELVSTSGPSSSSLKTDNLLDTPTEVDNTTGFQEKDEVKINTSGKRCKIIKKSINHVDQSTTAADIALSFSGVSEAMASKVCPVCKMFSSSSNTTLNAHIDQCLSMASTPKSISDSKLTRYRIKPRKTKLMVDIYATARTCTLEELDRRNGTSWATTLSCLPADNDIENRQTNINGGKKQKVVPVQRPEDVDNSAGAVYIDANGTKVRILSKFSSSSPLPKVQDDVGSRKLKVKERKFHSIKKKKSNASKHHKYFKVAAQDRKVSAQKCISQVREGHVQRKGSNSLEVHKITKQAKPYNSGTLRRWACSKRTRASKSTRKEGYQPSSFKWRVGTDRSVLTDSFYERSQVEDRTISSEHCVSSSESSDNTEYEVRISDTREWSPARRILRSSFSGEKVDSGSLAQTKQITNHPSKGRGFGGNNDLVKRRTNEGKIMKDYQPYDLPPGSNQLSRSYHENALKARKLNSFRRKEVLVSSRSSTGSKSPQFNRFSTNEKPGDHFGSHVEEGMFASWHSTFYRSRSSSDGSSETESDESADEDITEVSRELKNRRNREAMSKDIASSSSDSEPEYDGRHEKENMDSHIRMHAEFQEESKGIELGSKESSFYEDISVDSSSKLALKESFMCFCKSMDPPFQKMNNNAKTRCDVLQSTSNCPCAFYGLVGAKGGFSESSFGHGHEMFFTDEDCSAMIGHDQRDLDSEVGRGSSSFVVDPISIPGPPGSFLPSPSRDMRSEEYRGNSSLSNSCVHSCPDQHEFIDGDSSCSPISATSTISNSTAFRSCLKHNKSNHSHDLFHDKLGSVSQNVGALPSVENDVVCCTRDGKINGGGMFTVNKLSVERRSLGIVNDGQPCRCQRVDRAYQDINVNYQEPQLARHQSSTIETMPTIDRKQITYSPNIRRNGSDVMPEEPSLSHSMHALSDNLRIPVDKSPCKSHPVDGFSDLVPKFSTSNREPASPVTSNSVLRLMGKNLMVVNKEEVDVTKPAKHPELNHVSTQVPSVAADSSENVRSQASCSFPRWSHQDSLEDQNARNNALGRSLDLRLSKGFRKPANLNMPSSHVREPAALFLTQQTNGGHTASRAYKSDYRTQNEAATYNTSRILKMPDHHQLRNPLSAPGVTIPFPSSGNPLHVNAFCCYQPKDAASNLDKPASLHTSSFQSPPSRTDQTSTPVKWDCNSESPYVCRRGVF